MTGGLSREMVLNGKGLKHRDAQRKEEIGRDGDALKEEKEMSDGLVKQNSDPADGGMRVEPDKMQYGFGTISI
ncbi:MAG: hypothetical protein U1B83_01715 [Candidatus Cloacimonadaceae bacterium]|nr:hypothetical protein [Candidatus Cloacimonadaceae bacterium]